MRTTINLDEDILRAVKELARLRGSTAGQVLSDLARQALAVPSPPKALRNGVPLLSPVVGEGIVTTGHVTELVDDG